MPGVTRASSSAPVRPAIAISSTPTQRSPRGQRGGEERPFMTDLATTDSTVTVPPTLVPDPAAQLEQYRTELTAYAYRMLGSAFEAEDAVQETLVRAWRGLDRFEGRSALRSWLYRIATNVCLDMLGSRQRRARPIDMGPASVAPTE